MKYSGIGGQALIEGIMMKNQDSYSVAVRKANGEISVETKEYKGVGGDIKLKKIPFIRGVFNFLDSLVLGMKTIMQSADMEEEEDSGDKKEPKKEKGNNIETKVTKSAEENEAKQKKKEDSTVMIFAVVLAVIIAVGLFMLLPAWLSGLVDPWLSKVITNAVLLRLASRFLEGIIRIIIFILYILATSAMKDIRRTYMYHGGEHKCINCIEHGKFLTVENVRESSRFHKRCGTSFLLIVMIISVLVFMFVPDFNNALLRLLARLILVPVVAGISYEFLRLAGRSDNAIINILSAPGLLLQRITTREPDDSMIEVGIASVEAVFDWMGYLKENFPEEYAAQIDAYDKAITGSTEENNDEAEAEAETEAEPVAETEAEAEAESENEPKTEVEAEMETEPEKEPETEPETVGEHDE